MCVCLCYLIESHALKDGGIFVESQALEPASEALILRRGTTNVAGALTPEYPGSKWGGGGGVYRRAVANDDGVKERNWCSDRQRN